MWNVKLSFTIYKYILRSKFAMSLYYWRTWDNTAGTNYYLFKAKCLNNLLLWLLYSIIWFSCHSKNTTWIDTTLYAPYKQFSNTVVKVYNLHLLLLKYKMTQTQDNVKCRWTKFSESRLIEVEKTILNGKKYISLCFKCTVFIFNYMLFSCKDCL